MNKSKLNKTIRLKSTSSIPFSFLGLSQEFEPAYCPINILAISLKNSLVVLKKLVNSLATTTNQPTVQLTHLLFLLKNILVVLKKWMNSLAATTRTHAPAPLAEASWRFKHIAHKSVWGSFT